MTVEGPGIVPGSVRPAGDGVPGLSGQKRLPRDGIVVRIWENHGRANTVGRLSFFTPVRQAGLANLFGQREQPLDVEQGVVSLGELDRWAMRSLWLLPGTPGKLGPSEELGRTNNPFGPTHTRYWEYNTGAAALGAQPLSLVLRGSLSGEESSVEALVGNLYTGRTIEGTVRLAAGEGWSVGPAEFAFRLAPGEFMRQPVSVFRTRAATGGLGQAVLWRKRLWMGRCIGMSSRRIPLLYV